MRGSGWSYGTGGRNRAGRARRLCMEMLEPRLTLTWVGVPPLSVTPPTSAVAVTLNSQSDASGSGTIATTEVDYFSFTATASGSYTVTVTTPSSSLDTVIGVFSASGQRLAYNDDLSTTSTDSRLTINLSAGSRYFLGVTNYSSTTRGLYTFTIDGPTATTVADDAYENNDSFGAAYNLGTLTAARTVSSLKLADAEDWFRFTTSATGTSASSVSIGFQNSLGNLQLGLYNSAGTLLSTSATTGNTESISLSGRAAGTYYVRVYGNAGATNSNYSLTVTPPTVVTPPPTSSGGFQITLSMSGLTASQQAIFNHAADRWEQVIVGDLPNATYRGQAVDDLLINASAISIDGVNGILGQAGPDALRLGSRLPYHGIMQFDSADLARMETSGTLLSVVMHEMGHVLGIGTIWSSLGLLSGAGTSNPVFLGAQATAAYNQLFGTSARGVPVENTGGSGTRDAHWRDSIFRSELMTGWVGPGTNLPLSRVTVASLADIGYSVNLAMADSYVPTSTMLVAARATSGGGSAAARLYASVDTTQVDVPTEIQLPFSANTTHTQARRRPTFDFDAARLSRDAVDAVMTAAWERREEANEAPATSFVQPDDAEDAEFNLAWEDFELAWDAWALPV
ncbi:MAG: pre-peptidase C-terminal domain-containing protein [Planctomycetes bacterium]|nr:pre-peptidase C-terminal domain-containing protein [Planctomycetota bacterium]